MYGVPKTVVSEDIFSDISKLYFNLLPRTMRNLTWNKISRASSFLYAAVVLAYFFPAASGEIYGDRGSRGFQRGSRGSQSLYHASSVISSNENQLHKFADDDNRVESSPSLFLKSAKNNNVKPDPAVSTRYGKMIGRSVFVDLPDPLPPNHPMTSKSSVNKLLVHQFLGVPYAAPPVGRNRLAPTRSPPSWVGKPPLYARTHPPACPQVLDKNPLGAGDPIGKNQDEDCLKLSIYKPGEAGAPVLFFNSIKKYKKLLKSLSNNKKFLE